MRVVATSDFHGFLPEIPECELLLIAGDICPFSNHRRDFQANWLRETFAPWLDRQPALEVVWTGGNHDFVLQDMSAKKIEELGGWYLNGESITLLQNKIWASPMSPTFGQWAFMRDDSGLAEEWEKIPTDVNILMVHGPVYEYGDRVNNDWHPRDPHVGSKTLRNRLAYGEFPDLKLFVTGHIHEGYGWDVIRLGSNKFRYANVSYVNEKYNPGNKPMVFNV